MTKALKGLIQPGATPQVFRDVYTGRDTGLLRFSYVDDYCDLRFLRGNIVFAESSLAELQLGEVLVQRHLLTAHQLAEATLLVASEVRGLGDALIAKGYVSPAGLDAALTIYVQEVLARILTWGNGSYRFEVEETDILHESDVTLTQSTAELLLGAVSGVSDPDCIRFGLGSSDRVLIPTADPLIRFQRLKLSTVDGFVQSRLDGTLTVAEVIKLSGLQAEAVERSLLGLLCTGLVEPVADQAAGARAGETTQLLREQILIGYRLLDQGDDLALLGVSEDASDSEVKAAYLRLAKKFHPDVQHSPDLADLGSKLETLFVRLGEAYRKLATSDARAIYAARRQATQPPRAEKGAKAPAVEPADKQPDQQPVMPEEVYRKADDAYGEGKYWEAMALLGVAIQASSGALKRKGQLLLARAYLKYPDRVRDAEKELRGVIERDAENSEAHYLLGTIYMRTGMKARAVSQFRRTIELRPKHAEAREQLDRLVRDDEGDGHGGVLKKLFS